jgi:hypothetical protein
VVVGGEGGRSTTFEKVWIVWLPSEPICKMQTSNSMAAKDIVIPTKRWRLNLAVDLEELINMFPC